MRSIIKKTPVFDTQEKSVTGSRSNQEVTPDSGKYLTKVTVNKFPDATGTYTATSKSSNLDMGTTNNYRYVDTTGLGQEKTVMANYNADRVVTPDSGKYLSKVMANAFQHTAAYTVPSSHLRNADMGAEHNYRYVNLDNISSFELTVINDIKKDDPAQTHVDLDSLTVTSKAADGSDIRQNLDVGVEYGVDDLAVTSYAQSIDILAFAV